MQISIIGSGYVGLCSAVGFCSLGHAVAAIDIDESRASLINAAKPPFFESGLEESLKKFVSGKKLRATTDINAIKDTDITFIAVGTPSMQDGSLDKKYLESAAESIGAALKDGNKYHVIVIKSTVLPGTTEEVIIPLIERASGKKAGRDFGVCVNPEFLREGSALQDFLSPDRTVIGEFDKKSGDALEALYRPLKSPAVRTSLKTAEMIKYASNAFLATKISFINEVGNMCKKLGIDVYDVAKGMGYDPRIGERFLNAGCGFGGSCFPKDLSALAKKAEGMGIEPSIIRAVIDVNEKQKTKIVEILKERVKNLEGKKIAILGLAFKADTDDIRDSVSIAVISSLKKSGARISAYDPKAMENMKKIFPSVEYTSSEREALKNADACLILTDWAEFDDLTDDDFSLMKNKTIIEGRRVLNKTKVSNVEGVCW